MAIDEFFDIIFETLEYDLGDASPYGYYREILSEEFGNTSVSQSFHDAMAKLEIKLGEEIGDIKDATQDKYNAGAYFLARIPLELGDTYFSLYPSLLGDGWGEIAPHLGICVSGFGFSKGEFEPSKFDLPEEAYYRFVGEFIPPKALKGFSAKAVESLLTHFLGLTSRGLAAAILKKGMDEFRSKEEKLEGYMRELWEHNLKAIQETINHLDE